LSHRLVSVRWQRAPYQDNYFVRAVVEVARELLSGDVYADWDIGQLAATMAKVLTEGDE
jgi:hypothetical protein